MPYKIPVQLERLRDMIIWIDFLDFKDVLKRDSSLKFMSFSKIIKLSSEIINGQLNFP